MPNWREMRRSSLLILLVQRDIFGHGIPFEIVNIGESAGDFAVQSIHDVVLLV